MIADQMQPEDCTFVNCSHPDCRHAVVLAMPLLIAQCTLVNEFGWVYTDGKGMICPEHQE